MEHPYNPGEREKTLMGKRVEGLEILTPSFMFSPRPHFQINPRGAPFAPYYPKGKYKQRSLWDENEREEREKARPAKPSLLLNPCFLSRIFGSTEK